METKELKVYQTMKEYLDAYDYPSWKDEKPNNTLGSRHVMITASAQAKSFMNGLGRMSYFTTVAGNKDISDDEVMYELNTDFVLVLNVPVDLETEKHELIKVDGHDNAYIGVGTCFGEMDRLVYDIDTIINNLKEDGMTDEEAQEYFDYNIADAYVGEKMPVYVSKITLDELDNYNPA
jgi:hypothetical protein